MRGNGEDHAHGKEIRVEVSQDVKSRPANFMYVTHTPYDFTIDFAHIVPAGGEQPRALVNNRVVISPAFAQRLINTLIANVKKYEETFGPIVQPRNPQQQ